MGKDGTERGLRHKEKKLNSFNFHTGCKSVVKTLKCRAVDSCYDKQTELLRLISIRKQYCVFLLLKPSAGSGPSWVMVTYGLVGGGVLSLGCQGSRVAGRQVEGGSRRQAFLLQRLEHEELLEDLGLTGLPDLPRQEHLVHHRVHLGTQEVRYQGQEMRRQRESKGLKHPARARVHTHTTSHTWLCFLYRTGLGGVGFPGKMFSTMAVIM